MNDRSYSASLLATYMASLDLGPYDIEEGYRDFSGNQYKKKHACSTIGLLLHTWLSSNKTTTTLKNDEGRSSKRARTS